MNIQHGHLNANQLHTNYIPTNTNIHSQTHTCSNMHTDKYAMHKCTQVYTEPIHTFISAHT